MADANSYRNKPEYQRGVQNLNSLSVVDQIIDEELLQRVAEHAYSQYLAPKIRPFCAVSTVATMADQMKVKSQ